MNEALLQPEEHVLSTLERDGSRRWLKPRLSHGRWLTRRRAVAYVLILLFTVIPFIKLGGKPLLLLDVPARRFIIFGYTFLPTDTLLLAILLVVALLSIFLATALVGRVWCGWACPQTVYMEFLYRPIERLFDGTAGKGGVAKKQRPAAVTWLKYPLYLLASLYLANTFLAYFVGVDRLYEWVQQSPWHHPVPFLIVALVTIGMMVDFCYFREQVCILMCPYGRFQSVLLDPASMIVSYDARRGEPRGPVSKRPAENTTALPVLGDCVDCRLCVTTCPTGIDIRQGLQMECINCTQCIDACNAVMSKLHRPPNLIRYSSQRRDRGQGLAWLRPRVFIYSALLLGLTSALIALIVNKKPFDAMILRERGVPFTLADSGARVRNVALLKLTNRTDRPLRCLATIADPPGVELHIGEKALALGPEQSQTFHLEFLAPRAFFAQGPVDIRVRLAADNAVRELEYRLVGPRNQP